MYVFVLNRISMIFLLLTALLCLPIRYSVRKTGLFCFISYCITAVADYYTYVIFEEEIVVVICNLIFQVIITQGTIYLISQYKDVRTIFTGISCAAMVLPGNILGDAFQYLRGNNYRGYFVATFFHIMIIVFIIVKFRKAYLKQIRNYSKSFWVLCLIPITIYLLEFSLVQWPGKIEEYPQNIVAAILVLPLMLGTYSIVLHLLELRSENNSQQKDMEIMENYSVYLKEQAETMYAAHEKAAIVRHDSKHYLLLLKDYINNKEYDSAQKMISQYYSELEDTRKVFCSNLAINSVLSSYAQKAETAQISLDCQIDIPEKMEIEEYQLAVVVANVLSNALRESSKCEANRREITFKLMKRKDYLILESKNFYEGTITIDADGIPVSNRGEEHGYGMKSIAAFSRKYKATFDCGVEEEQFYIRMMIPLFQE